MNNILRAIKEKRKAEVTNINREMEPLRIFLRPETKNTVIKMKNAFKGHITRLSQAKNELEYRSIKTP